MATKEDWCERSTPGAGKNACIVRIYRQQSNWWKVACSLLSPWVGSSNHCQWCHAPLFRADHFHLISSLVPTRNSSFVVCLISSFSCFRLKATFLFFAIHLERWLPPCDVNLPFCISSLVFSQQCLIQVIIELPSKMGASSSISQWPKNSSFMFLVLWLFFSHRTLTLLLERSILSSPPTLCQAFKTGAASQAHLWASSSVSSSPFSLFSFSNFGFLCLPYTQHYFPNYIQPCFPLAHISCSALNGSRDQLF